MKSLRIIFLLFPAMIFSQEFELKGMLEATAIVSSANENPFWFHANSHYAVGELTNLSATAGFRARYILTNFELDAGASGYGRDGVITDNIQRKELYLQFKNSWLRATLGSKARPVVADGLSATNKNFLWSGNARPMPGLILEANEPLKISNTFSLDWGIAHYQLNDDRFVKDVRVHYKRLGLITRFNEHNTLLAQIQHFAQWGGTSPEYGKLKDDLKTFGNVFFALTSEELGTEGEIANVVGNHLGSYLLDYQSNNDFGNFSLYHEHPFDDGSGTSLKNFPDGVWGVFYQPHNNSIVSSLLYEFITTTNQSGTKVNSGFDNYFNNSGYRSGWTYERNIIGLPFMIINEKPFSDIEIAIVSNSLRIHHLGISGSFGKIEWMLKSSYVENFGLKSKLFETPVKNWFNYISFNYKTEKLGAFKIMGGLDFSNVEDTILGGGATYSYSF